MPIDPNIPLAVRPVSPIGLNETPMESQAKAVALQGNVLEQQQKIRALRTQQAFGQAIAENGGDVEKALPQLYRLDPMTAMGIHRQITADKQKAALGELEAAKSKREAQKAQFEQLQQLSGHVDNILAKPPEEREAAWEDMRQGMKQFGGMDLPAYSEQTVNWLGHGLDNEFRKMSPSELQWVASGEGPHAERAKRALAMSPAKTSAPAMDAEYQRIIAKQNLGQEDLTPEEVASKDAYETRKSGVAPEDINTMADMLRKGDLVPSQMAKRGGSYNRAIAKASRDSVENGGQPLSPAKMQLEYDGAKRFIGTLNNQQNLNFNRLGSSIKSQIEEVQMLADQLKQSGVQKWNSAKRSTIQQLWGNSPQSELANRYMTALTGLQSEMAQFESGGFAPQVGGWEIAKRQLNSDYGLRDMTAALDEIGRQVGFRLKAQSEARPMMPGGGDNRFAPPPTQNNDPGGLFR